MRVGDVVAGRYELAAVLGTGGMARVYRAHDRVLERDVALKVLDERLSEDPEYVERFRREARAIARLSHPNIVTVIDRGETEGWQFIVFEYVRGPNLKQLLQRRGPLPVREALALAHQAARGLGYAHENGVVHRDVKPQNVLVDPDGVAKVTDFGIARAPGGDQGLTMTGTILGTGDYLSPEQASGQPVDARSDQYSLGVLLFELLTGEPPYTGESLFAVAARHVNDPIPSVRERRPEVSPRLEASIRRAMAKRPDERFPTTDALIAALEASMAEEAGGARARGEADDGATEIIAPAAARAVESPRQKRRRLPLTLLAGLAVLATAGLVVWALATERFIPGDGEPGAGPVRLVALDDYDPEGDAVEHPELLAQATDGDQASFWRTETYRGGLDAVGKSGVGIVVDARRRRELGSLTLVTDTPGFTATIRGGNSTTGDFEDLTEPQEVAGETTFRLGGGRFRFYLVWITELDEVAYVNEVRAG